MDAVPERFASQTLPMMAPHLQRRCATGQTSLNRHRLVSQSQSPSLLASALWVSDAETGTAQHLQPDCFYSLENHVAEAIHH